VTRNGANSRLFVIVLGCALVIAVDAAGIDGWPTGVELTNTGAGTLGGVWIADDDELEPQTFTVEAWIRPLGNGYGGTGDSWGAVIVDKGGEGQGGTWVQSYYLAWTPLNNTICASVTHQWDSFGVVLNSTGTVSIGERAHAAISFDGDWLRVFINGQFDSEIPAGSSTIAYSDDDLLIGAGAFASGYIRAFQGIVDDVRIWNYARSAGEISAQMACSLDGTESGLLAYYSFNNGDLSDDSGNGHGGVADGLVDFVLSNDQCLPFVSDFETADLTDWSVAVP